MNEERGVGCVIMLGVVFIAYASAQAASQATPVGLFIALAVLAVGFFFFMASFR